MIIAIQQPEHLPWLGFFHKMTRCDEYVYLDNVQFKKRYFENRNKILTFNGPQWVTVPVISKGKFTQRIDDVLIDNSSSWRRKYLGSIKTAYSATPGFSRFYPKIEKILDRNHEKLVDLNLDMIACMREFLQIDTPCHRASELLKTEATGSGLILEICVALEADTYISGPDGRNYLNLQAFQEAGIKIEYHVFNHPVYQQVNAREFVSHLSVIDYILNIDGTSAPVFNGNHD